jgi:hypothetical protein
MLTALRLAREGFGGGDPGRILEMPTDQVLLMIEYVQFQNDYESTVIELNKAK